MCDKIEAKKIAIEAGVSTVPGYMGTINDVKQAIDIAKEIGFPVIVKAAAGKPKVEVFGRNIYSFFT